ncbi:hypothetical protein VitviT2T_030729 [Vitis vinifera]|uniref:F-box protein n=1 Tax=Vitis vinifera TaxID=29760 RepID=A0ABY9E1X6_VITVI|nr:hypothetical protein VitviT2T_030729 [Vitis vinifera]
MKKRRRSDFSQKHSDSVPKCYVSVDLSVLGLLLTSEKYHGMSGVGKRWKSLVLPSLQLQKCASEFS